MEDHFSSDYCEVCYIAADQVVLIRWKQFCSFEDYRTPTLFALELLRCHAGSNLVIDARNGFEDDKEDIVWAFSTLLPAMAKTSCKTIVLIMREVNDIEDEMDLWSAEFSKYFAVHRVMSYEQAVECLQQ